MKRKKRPTNASFLNNIKQRSLDAIYQIICRMKHFPNNDISHLRRELSNSGIVMPYEDSRISYIVSLLFLREVSPSALSFAERAEVSQVPELISAGFLSYLRVDNSLNRNRESVNSIIESMNIAFNGIVNEEGRASVMSRFSQRVEQAIINTEQEWYINLRFDEEIISIVESAAHSHLSPTTVTHRALDNAPLRYTSALMANVAPEVSDRDGRRRSYSDEVATKNNRSKKESKTYLIRDHFDVFLKLSMDIEYIWSHSKDHYIASNLIRQLISKTVRSYFKDDLITFNNEITLLVSDIERIVVYNLARGVLASDEARVILSHYGDELMNQVMHCCEPSSLTSLRNQVIQLEEAREQEVVVRRVVALGGLIDESDGAIFQLDLDVISSNYTVTAQLPEVVIPQPIRGAVVHFNDDMSA